MTLSSPSALQRLCLSFELDPGDANCLRNLPLLHRLTEGRVQTRRAASGPGFRSHRLLRLEADGLVDFLLALEPTGLGVEGSQGPSTGLRARLHLSPLSGEDDRFLAFVQALHALVPLRLSPLQEQASTPSENLPALDPAEATDVALAAILRRCQSDMLRWIDLAWRDLKPEAVHQTRVGLRRLRAALGLFKPVLPPALAVELNEEARWLGSVLAPTRDLDVFLSETLAPFHARMPNDPGLATLTKRATSARAESAQALIAALRSPRCLALSVRLELSIERRLWREQAPSKAASGLFAPLRDVGPELLDRLWRAARKDAKRLPEGGAEAAHDLRKKIKKLRYSIEFLENMGVRKDVRAFLGEVTLLQQKLGVANDVTVAQGLIERLCAQGGGPDLSHVAGYIKGWYARGAVDSPFDAVEGWKRLVAAPRFWRQEHGPA